MENMETNQICFETEVRIFDEVPVWIEQDITVADVIAITEGGCESGAYMPAVTYYKAREIMHEHGDEVLEYLHGLEAQEDLRRLAFAESPLLTWSEIAVHFLSSAVEWWAWEIFHKLCGLGAIE